MIVSTEIKFSFMFKEEINFDLICRFINCMATYAIAQTCLTENVCLYYNLIVSTIAFHNSKLFRRLHLVIENITTTVSIEKK